MYATAEDRFRALAQLFYEAEIDAGERRYDELAETAAKIESLWPAMRERRRQRIGERIAEGRDQ
ncbi:MAG: hypothetical protein KGL39_42520 [Patescibacteria group bacterium]|nr:hypothetical protein [Patescibacteria group bacterium]